MSTSSDLSQINSILTETPSTSSLSQITSLIKNEVILNAFCNKLVSEEWAKYIFQNNDFLLELEDRFDGKWPYRTLCKRFAKEIPEDITKALVKIYQSKATLDEQFTGTVIETALAIHSQESGSCISLLPVIIDGHKSNCIGPWLNDSYRLCSSLLENGSIDSKDDLVEELFFSDRAIEILKSDRSAYFYTEFFPKVSALISEKENLKEWVQRVARLLIDVLHAEKDIKDNKDHSYITRPAIEEHTHNSGIRRYTNLIPVLRDACEKGLVANGIEEVFDWLAEYELDFFQRLRIHLARIYRETSSDQAKAFMLDKSFLTDYWVSSPMHHEYAVLCRDTYPLLKDEEKVAWIEKVRNEFIDENPKEEYKKHHLAKRLRWVYNSLSSELKKESDELTEEYRASEFDWFHSTGVKNIVYNNAYKYDKLGLQQKNFQDALNDLIELKPKSTWDDEDPLHPNSILKGVSSLIKENPDDASTRQEQLLATPAKFHGSIVEGIRQLVDQGDED